MTCGSGEPDESVGAGGQDRPLGWYAYADALPDAALLAPTDLVTRLDEDPFALREGDTITLRWEEDVDCPLWNAGLLWNDADEFIEFGAPEELARDLARWSAVRQVTGRSEQSDLDAQRLVERLTEVFEQRYRFVYRP